MYKVSVIIPIYRVEKYISRCAKSLFDQTLDSIEYIFIDDCSPDNSVELLKEILNEYPDRIEHTRIIRMPYNLGLPTVRKYGINLATGEYIIHCDSDDWLPIDAYERLYTNAIKNNSDIAFCDYYKSDGETKCLISRDIDVSTQDTVYYTISRNAYWTVWAAMIKREIYTRNEIIYPTNNNGEDFALMFQLIYYSKTFSKINMPLYFYYHNTESITYTQSIEAHLDRYTQLKNNTDLVIDFVRNKNEIVRFKELVLCYKIYCRTKLSPITGLKKYRQLWSLTYPEINILKVMFNGAIPLRTRINFILVVFNIYHIIAK